MEHWLTLRNPSTAQGHFYLHQLLFLAQTAPEHRRQNPYHKHPERLGVQSFPQPAPPALPLSRARRRCNRAPRWTRPPRYRKGEAAAWKGPNGTAKTTDQWPGRRPAGASPGIPRGADNTGQKTARHCRLRSRPSPWDPWRRGQRNCCPTSPAETRDPAAGRNAHADGTLHGGAALGRHSGATGRESFVYHHGPAQIAGSIQGPQRDAPHPWHATLRERTRVRDAGGGAPPPGPQQGEALLLQAAGYQAILPGHARGYRSHILAGGRWTVWHGTARQGAFPPQRHVDWQQGPTKAYYMTADPWLLAVLLHTVSAPNKRQEPGWATSPALVWSPDEEGHLRGAWHGDAIRDTDVTDLHVGPITHARPAATLAVAQQEQQNPQ